jgi:hypothetical protein
MRYHGCKDYETWYAYNDACLKATKENYEAHDNYPDIPNPTLKRVKIEHGYRGLERNTYDTSKLYLVLDHEGRWLIGRLSYYDTQKRFIFHPNWGVNSLQVEHMHQLYEIDLPKIPEYLVDYPVKPEMTDEEIEKALDDDCDE